MNLSVEDIALIAGRELSPEQFRVEVLADYNIALQSREMSLLGRREVLSGKAKFGIMGDGKELAQIALAKNYQNGDFRAGYYRDQTMMLAAEIVTIEQLFAQLYANANPNDEPHSAGRQMNAHFATHSLDEHGNWNDLTKIKNTSADYSSTAGQMPRAIGLALASKKFRQISELSQLKQFSDKGNEVTFCNIGDASTSEGHFWEAMNAAGVLQIPLAVSVWDDGYGISVATEHQTTKGSISEALRGMERNDKGEGILMYTAKGWDYPQLCQTYREGLKKVREEHIPTLFHIKEVGQPQGHSTSGDHRRYKSEERLKWEEDFDCIKKMREWLLETGIADDESLKKMETQAREYVIECRNRAWKKFNEPILKARQELLTLLNELVSHTKQADFVRTEVDVLSKTSNPTLRDVAKTARIVQTRLLGEKNPPYQELKKWTDRFQQANKQYYNTFLYSQSKQAAHNVPIVAARYSETSPWVNGSQVINACFDAAFARIPHLFAFGEDVGKIGDVNQGFAGLQAKYGEERVFDTGIRELTIMGQGIGMAMRGLRPIAEIQYIDYFVYGLQPLTDDLASLHYRTAGRQKAPLIVRTRGHRLEGVWHSGSPMGMLLHALRGMHLLVPRNMTQAAGFYNTLLLCDEPAVVVERLNAYRLKEQLPDNIGEFTVPFGVPEVLRQGNDICIVTYGACCAIALDAAEQLAQKGIECEIIDVQSLLPFDTEHRIVQSVKKTNRVLFLDEDVPGGASAYMMQQVLEVQGGYVYLDSKPTSITAQAHRPAYGSDGDYYSKPNAEDVVEQVYAIMHEFDPQRFTL